MRSKRRIIRKIAREQGVSVEEVEAMIERLTAEGALAKTRTGPLAVTKITEAGREQAAALRRAFEKS